jgi:hypothetical protein
MIFEDARAPKGVVYLLGPSSVEGGGGVFGSSSNRSSGGSILSPLVVDFFRSLSRFALGYHSQSPYVPFGSLRTRHS